MIQIFEDILQKRRWRGANAKATLERIENRLKKRIPPGQELQLTAFQETVINHPLFWRDQNQDAASQHLMIQGATSAGKTLVSELAIIDTIYCGELKKAIVLVPLKAMVRERTAHFREDMGHGRDDSEVRVYGSSGDYLDNDDRIINGEYEVAIIVYEKFFAMLSQNNSQKLMENCDLLVVDELSVLSSEQRGPKLEMALEIVNSRYSNTRIMCLATCDCSTQKICNWLKIEKPIKSFARPVALEEHIVQLNGREIFRLIPENCSEDYEPKMQEGRIEIQNYNPEWRRSEKERRLLLTVMKELYTKMNDTRVLVFVPTQSAAANIADYLKEKIHEWLPTDDIVIEYQYDQEFTEALKNCERDEGQERLINTLLPVGIAYHHAGISTTLRELIEEQFSDMNSPLKVIVATETLTMGVNLPFDAMIMLSNKVPRGKGEMEALTGQEYRNYIGRAGRLGQSNRMGITYLFTDNPTDSNKYWESYFQQKEVTSALPNDKPEILAPYYLSLLTRQSYNQKDIENLYKASFLNICKKGSIDAARLESCLESANLSGSRGGKYALRPFGQDLAPFALSIETCQMIYKYFYRGSLYGGLPENTSPEDIDNDRYLLDILYHICWHSEIENSSNLLYPVGSNRMQMRNTAKRLVLKAFHDILNDQNTETTLFCDAYSGGNQEEIRDESDLYQLKQREINLVDEEKILQAAMRAIVLYYWTKGCSVQEIRNKTKFESITKLTSGDIERMAEVVSFHVNAIYCSLVSTEMAAYQKIYSLHIRIKYGMSRDLAVFASKHIHGLDRNRLLNLKKAAEKRGFTPKQYLYLTAPNNFAPNTLTFSQQAQLKIALERRGSENKLNLLMEYIEKGISAEISSEALNSLKNIADWDNLDERDTVTADTVFDSLNKIIESTYQRNIRIVTKGSSKKIEWIFSGNDELYIGVITSTEYDDDLNVFLNQDNQTALSSLMIVPRHFNCDQRKKVMQDYHVNAVLDNIYVVFLLAKAISMNVDDGYALTEMLADMRGIFTDEDYFYFPMLNYLKKDRLSSVSYRIIYGCDFAGRFENIFANERPEAVLYNPDELQSVEVIPWGRQLNSAVETSRPLYPTVIFLNRKDIIRSASLSRFIYKMDQEHFRNCILIAENERTLQEWNREEDPEETNMGYTRWRGGYQRIVSRIASDKQALFQEISSFVRQWEHPGYLIGISYAHYDEIPSAEDKKRHENDVDKLILVVNALIEEYGQDRILFDGHSQEFGFTLGEERSLEAYKTCTYFVVLWNYWTKNSECCKNELNIITPLLEDKKHGCAFLQTGRSGEPQVPPGHFNKFLSKDTVKQIVDEIKSEISKLLSQSAD